MESKAIANALMELQKEVKVLKTNSAKNYNYRSVEQIYAEIKPIMQKLGVFLTLSDEIIAVDNRVYVKATATLSNGKEQVSVSAYAREKQSSQFMDEAQLTGACSSYARKYALGGLLLLDDNKDIDSLDNNHNGNEKVVQVKAPPVDLQLKKLKEQVFAELQAGGVEREDMMPFFTFAGIDKDSKKDLQDFLNCDMQSLISSFFDNKDVKQVF